MKDTRMDRCHRRAFYCAQPRATMTDRNGPATDGREGQQLEREEFESTGRRSAYALLRMLIQVPAAVRRWPADKMSRYVLHYPRHPHIRKRRHGSNSSDGIDQNVPPPPPKPSALLCVCVAYFFFFLILFSTVGEKEEVEDVLHRQLSSRLRILYSTVDKAQARFGQAIYLISFFIASDLLVRLGLIRNFVLLRLSHRRHCVALILCVFMLQHSERITYCLDARSAV